MSYLEVAKIHPKLGNLLEEVLISEKDAKEYATKHGVSIEDITNMRVDGALLLGMNRHITAVGALEANKRIPNDVVFDRIDAGGVESEWIYVSGAKMKKVFFSLIWRWIYNGKS